MNEKCKKIIKLYAKKSLLYILSHSPVIARAHGVGDALRRLRFKFGLSA